MPAKFLLAYLCAFSFCARAGGENFFDRFLGSLSKGAHYLEGNSCEKANEAEAAESLNRAAAAVCAKLGQNGALTRQTEDLARIADKANESAEDKFFAMLATNRSIDMKCAAGNAGALAKENPGGAKMKDLVTKVLMVRDAKLKLAGLAVEASSKGIVCGPMEDQTKPDPMFALNNQRDLRFEYCRDLKIARLTFQALSESFPFAGTPSMQKYLNKAQVDRSLSEEGAARIAADLKAALTGAQSELAGESERLRRLGAAGGGRIDRSTRRALASDPRKIQELVEAGGNTPGLRALACDADGRYGAGADSFDRAMLVGTIATLPVMGAGSLAVRGIPALRAIAAARAVGAVTLNGARLVQLGVMGMGAALSYEQIDKACLSSGAPRMAAQGGPKCEDMNDAAQIEKDNCLLAGVMTGLGGTALLASSRTVRGFVAAALKRSPAAVAPLANLEARAVKFTSSREIPGGAGGPSSLGMENGRFLRTTEITASDLPYPSEIRAIDRAGLNKPAVTRLNPSEVTRSDIILASDEHSGSAGVVRLGSVNGRPVAIKAYATQRKELAMDNKFILEEAANAKLLSDLGIGPKFHGIYQDSTGRWNMVTDVVRGDFTGTRVTAQSFDDLRTIEKRLHDAGISHAPDFQPYRTQDGRMLVIDANLARDATRPELTRDISVEMAKLIREADPELGLQQLRRIQANEPERMPFIRRIFSNYQRNTGKLPEHLRPYLE
jgi:hypothetical protein